MFVVSNCRKESQQLPGLKILNTRPEHFDRFRYWLSTKMEAADQVEATDQVAVDTILLHFYQT